MRVGASRTTAALQVSVARPVARIRPNSAVVGSPATGAVGAAAGAGVSSVRAPQPEAVRISSATAAAIGPGREIIRPHRRT